jgi:hypothetical protein
VPAISGPRHFLYLKVDQPMPVWRQAADPASVDPNSDSGDHLNSASRSQLMTKIKPCRLKKNPSSGGNAHDK